MDSEHANNLAYIAIAIQSLFFTSDWFYKRIRTFLNRRLENAKGLNRQIYLGLSSYWPFLNGHLIQFLPTFDHFGKIRCD